MTKRIIYYKPLLINSLMLGVASVPLIYMLVGALFAFPAMFSVIFVPPYLLLFADIIRRCVISPKVSNWVNPMMIGVWLMLICLFILLISDFNLQTDSERLFHITLFAFIGIILWSGILWLTAKVTRND